MKKISEWSDRAINWLGAVVTIIMVVLLIAFAKYVERCGGSNPGAGAAPVSVEDSLEVGKAFVDTVGLLTVNPDAILPVRALRVDDVSEEVVETPGYTVWFYPVDGDVNRLEWTVPYVGIWNYTSRVEMDSGRRLYVYDDSSGPLRLSTSFPYIIMTI